MDLVLWWTGAIVENTYGRKVFFTVLLSGVLAGASIWWLTGLGGARAGSSLIGISAGVYALMLVALLDKLEHQITVLLFFFLPVTLKVRWVLGVTALLTAIGWIFSELPFRHVWSGWTPAWQDAIAHSAHLGGLIFGWFAWRRLNRTNADLRPVPRPRSQTQAGIAFFPQQSPSPRPTRRPFGQDFRRGIRLAHPGRETQTRRPQRPPPLTPHLCADSSPYFSPAARP
ncbi:MAG: rhomboid family intramembrane serine protease [Verrucomicrobia bacterium]|nr:rhomboid family intramembrane serine protease [Verrucomicrobiota bacterium]